MPERILVWVSCTLTVHQQFCGLDAIVFEYRCHASTLSSECYGAFSKLNFTHVIPVANVATALPLKEPACQTGRRLHVLVFPPCRYHRYHPTHPMMLDRLQGVWKAWC